MIESFSYTLKVWLTTATLPLFIVWVISCCGDPREAFNDIALYFLALIVSVAASFLTWIVFSIAVYNVLKLALPNGQHKLLIQMFGLGLTLITFVIFAVCITSIDILGDMFFWIAPTSYMICLAASIHFYNLPQLYIEHQENSTIC
jgi:hypothetical protein